MPFAEDPTVIAPRPTLLILGLQSAPVGSYSWPPIGNVAHRTFVHQRR
jgi:hypothetical protein